MHFQNFQIQATDFKNRIIKAFQLKEDLGQLVQHRKKVIQWIRKKQQDLQIEKKTKLNQNIIKSLLNKAVNEQKRKKLERQIFLHQQLKASLKLNKLDQIKNLDQFIAEQLFKDIKQDLQIVLKNQIKEFYGLVKTPLIGTMLIQKKEHFKKCVENSPNNNLKFIVTESKVAHKYQRNLVQQVFGRVIRKKGALSLMIKIEVNVASDEKDIELYCYIEDLSFKGQQYKQLSEVELVSKDDKYSFQIKKNNNQSITINKQSILEIFLSQMIVIPLQTLVSEYIIEISKQGADIIKYHKGSMEQIDQSILLKDHPSIRNPIFYFRDYIVKNEIPTSQILSFNTKKIYGNFYRSLNIIAKLITNDFSFYLDQNRINSLCFNTHTFSNIWQVIHELVMISDWVEQIINPIKSTVTIYQIINKFCPILGQMVNFQGKSFAQYKTHLLNLEADTFMASFVSKNIIQRYKDVYVSLNNYDDQNQYLTIFQVYDKIFAPIMDQFDLANCDLYQAVYFLNFVGQNKFTDPNFTIINDGKQIHPSWKNQKIWKKVYKLKQSQQLPYINLYLDIFGFYLEIDTIQISSKPFSSVQNQIETPQLLRDLDIFVKWMSQKLQIKYNNYLSILFQKAYKHKKYKICNVLLNDDIIMNDFEDVFQFQELLTQEEQLQKQQLCQNMKKKSPQMYRKLKWEELIRKTLSREDIRKKNSKYDQQLVTVKAFKYGEICIKKQIFQAMQISEIENNISRKDYMFDPQKNMIKVNFSEGNDAYFQYTEYPLVRYFYKTFLQKVNKAHLMPNFTGVLTENGSMLHLIESIPGGLNFQKGYSSLSQLDLKNLLNKDQISQSILLSIILMPSKILLKNIIVFPADTPNNSIFMIDLKQFYRSNAIQRSEGSHSLKSVNCLFTFDEMNKSISQDLIKKFSNLQILPHVENIFIQLSKLVKVVNESKLVPEKNNHQLLGLIFQQNFIINLTERMFKIQKCFIDCLQKNKSISPMEVLSSINQELSYFYQEIIRSSSSLIQRQKKLLDEMWRKPFVNKINLIQFFASSSIVSQPLNAFPNHYRKLCFEGPAQSLNRLFNQSKKFAIYSNKVQKLDVNNNQILEYYVRNIDFSKLNIQQRKLAVAKLKQKSKQYLVKKGQLPLHVLKLQDIDIMKASELDFAYERVKQVMLENIKTNDVELSSMLKLLESAICIKMKQLKGITSLGQSSYLSFSLELKNLRILSINQCSQLKFIDIKCDALESVTFRDNQSLEIVYVSSFSLKNIDCTGSNKIKLQNIGLYILKGLNVLLSDIACDGYLKKLLDSSYSNYVFNILKFLLNRLKESQIKAIIITTLTKLKLLDEEMASTLLGVPSMNKVTSMLLKYSYELDKKVYFRLIDLYFNNEMVDSFSITQMSVTNIEQIAAYMKQNGKKCRNSFKMAKINQTIKNNVQCFKNIFSFINLAKHYKLSLQQLQFDVDEDAVQIIDLLINKREELQKIDLMIEHCKISSQLFEIIFKRKNVTSLHIFQSTINNGISSNQSLQSLKELKIKDTSINNFELLNKLDHLVVLKINNCQLPNQLTYFYSSIGKKKNLKIFKFTNQKSNNKEILIDCLLQNLLGLQNLSILNLSNNCFNQNQLKLINQFTSKSNLDELILRNFYPKGQTYTVFSTFLKDSKIKQLIIQFPLNDNSNLKMFISALSQQKTIVKLFLQTQTEIDSQIFSSLNNNKCLNTINSNQLIPTWLKKHLKNNTKDRSKIWNNKQSIGTQFGIFSGRQSRYNDYHKLGLSMDGGGCRGLLIATELQYLVEQVGYPLHKIFDVIGGTSIGGIEALLVSTTLDNAHPIMTPSEVKQLFTIHGKEIFKKSQIRSFTSLYDTKYNPSYLQNLMNTYFKDCKLSQTLKQTNCIVTAVNRMNNKDMIFKSTQALLNRDKDFYAKDIARATSAAPTYFPSAQIKNIIASQKYSLVDGGMGMNNPSKLVIDEVKKMAFNSHNENDFFLLSLGTGRLPSQIIPEYAGIKDLAPIIDSFTQSACYFTERDLTQNYKGHFIRVSPLINLSKKQGQLDSTEESVLKTYQQTGLSAAKEYFSNTIIFGKYRTMSLIEWLRQNTERKFDI